MQEARKISTGIPGLDELLYGGILAGDSILIEGAPGTGKTTFGLQFIYAGIVHYEEPGLIITFEQFPEQMYRDALNFGWDLRALEEQNRLRVICTSPQLLKEELEEPGGMFELIAAEIGAKRVLVDSINHFQRITDDRMRLRELLNTFLNGLKRQRLTSVLVKELDEINGVSIGFEAYMVDAALRISYETEPGGVRRARYLEILKTRGQEHRSGRHTFQFGPHGLEVFPVPALPTGDILGNPLQRVPTGIAGLDEMLHGGLVGGFCTLVAGAPGTGKTTLGLQYLHHGVLNDEPSLFVSLQERLYKIFKTAEGYGFLRDLVRKDCFRALCVPPAATNVNKLFADIRDSIEQMHIRRVVIDGLTELKTLLGNPNLLREYLYSLTSLFEQHGITAVLTHEIEAADTAPQPIEPELSPFIDTIIHLRCLEHQGVLKRTISILKMRTSSHDMHVREFEIGSSGIRILGQFPGP